MNSDKFQLWQIPVTPVHKTTDGSSPVNLFSLSSLSYYHLVIGQFWREIQNTMEVGPEKAKNGKRKQNQFPLIYEVELLSDTQSFKLQKNLLLVVS